MANNSTNLKQKFMFPAVNVKVFDNRGNWKLGMPNPSAIVTFNPNDNTMEVVLPEPVKRDTSTNPPLYNGELTKMRVTVRKDGSFGFSWTPKAGELRLIGINKVVGEFRKAMEKYFEAIA